MQETCRTIGSAAWARLGAALFAVLALVGATSAQGSGPTVSTNLPDYTPGMTVEISGSGFAPFEDVTLQVVHLPVVPPCGSDDHPEHQPWTVPANGAGGFASSWVVPLDAAGCTMLLTADGELSDLHAETTFADAPAQANLDQARNGSAASPVSPVDMQNGNLGASQSHYVESQSVPYRAVMENLPINTPITITLGYDIKNSSKHAIDYLTHYNRLLPHSYASHTTPETIDILEGLSGAPTTFTTFPIPAPSSAGSPVSGQPTTSFNALPAAERLMTLYAQGGAISAISYATQGSLTAASSQTTIDVTFTITGPNTTAVLAWGGHIGSRIDWGFTAGVPNSAGGISGSPYHMRLEDWNLNNLGNQDRSLSADAVVPPPTCSISGPGTPCAGSTNTYTASTDASTATYLWSLINNTSGASIVGSATGPSVSVSSGGTGGYTVQVAITANGFTTTCTYPVTVNAVGGCSITGPSPVCPSSSNVYSAPGGMAGYQWSISGNGTIPGSTTGPTVTVLAAGSCSGSYTLTLTITTTGGCVSTCSSPFLVVDVTPPTIGAPGANATIDCAALTF